MAERRSETSDITEFMRRIASCRLLITGRFHAFILALATGTPVLVAGSNTHKIAATLRDAGLSQKRSVEPSSVTPAMIDAAAQWSPEEHAALDRFVVAGRTAIRALFEDVRRIAR
jgi:polysaccharide pyruvyl transferase WcaK-like protein